MIIEVFYCEPNPLALFLLLQTSLRSLHCRDYNADL